ncbi:DUF3592 domain-containing protein [Legionella jordanis]|uniref:DUF3592 domain-containing protein n=1 Tax=Legionella jordanis TaxID=456 RepID=A0A0W0VDB4_9GAMM|nr:DUF3592 domain-containing protein [Legionella jordanis]KTD18116.1 hypothetical protein Ljor_2422 [Legionella jordanis]RMX00574.1 DUF3592 domain-containing protein [Legionella jordanis]RMX21310.1 DUF3592 domain-containing protein [Legionella jordanis]VEH13791.1 Protein of uncharacterised function (DUF3592) [Legionella jordanis]HAT8714174.1 DUF3592 domain-containing protein [Legionella jordanis]
MKQFASLLILASAASFLLAGYYFIEAWHITHHSVQTTGTIVGFVAKTSQNNLSRAQVLHYPVIRFSTQKGQIIEFQSQLGFYPSAPHLNESITVIYHPDHPKHNYANSYFILWLRFSLVLLAAFFFALLATFLYKIEASGNS